MNNNTKIEKLEKEIKILSKEYNEIRDNWKHIGSSLDVRDIEIRNKCLEVQQLNNAQTKDGE